MNNKYINLIVFVVIFVCYIYLEYYVINNINFKEGFEVNGDKLLIKKTLKYNNIYSTPNYTVWEPEPIDDYFPLSQSVTKYSSPPKNPAILVKSDSALNDRPESYTVVATTEDSIPVWEVKPKKGYIALGNVISKQKPSKHKFRCIDKRFTKISSIENNICLKKMELNGNNGYTIWNVRDTDNFVCSSLNNSNIPSHEVYDINKSYLNVEKSLKIKKTKTFDKVWNYFNIKSKKHISIWRPRELGDYYPVGYIAIASNINPNENMETVLVHKDFVKSPIDYGDNSISTFKLKKTDTKNDTKTKYNEVSFWRPIPPVGYTCLSDIVVPGSEEPDTNNLIYCIPLEYTNTIQNNIKEVWNTIPNLNNKLSVFTDNNSYLWVNNDYSKPNINQKDLNYDLIENDIDLLDLSRKIVFKYELNKNNTEIYDEEKRQELILKSLSNRLGVHTNRFKNIIFSKKDSTLSLSVVSRPAGSDELSTYEIKKSLTDMIKNKSLRINNSKNDSYIMILTDIHTIEPTNEKIIALDNRSFSDMLNN